MTNERRHVELVLRFIGARLCCIRNLGWPSLLKDITNTNKSTHFVNKVAVVLAGSVLKFSKQFGF